MERPGERIESMDALRGLASLQVVIGHALLIIPAFTTAIHTKLPMEGETLVNVATFSPLHFAWAAHEAVILFFVMSGFVLSIPFYKKKKLQFTGFLTKRLFRIYFPYVIVLIIGWVCNLLFLDHTRNPDFSEWFNSIWSRPVTLDDWYSFLTLQDSSFHNVVTSLWTLPIEIKASLLMPFVALAFDRVDKPLIFFGIIVLNILLFKTIGYMGWDTKWPFLKIFYYVTFFLIGATLSKYRSRVASYLNGTTKPVLITLLVIAGVLYIYEWVKWILPDNAAIYIKKVLPGDYMVAVAAVMFIAMAITQRGAALLNRSALVKLGEISFSLYLLHPIVIGLLGYTVGHVIPVYILIPLTVLLSIAVAFPFSKFVELPFQNIGRKLSSRLTRP